MDGRQADRLEEEKGIRAQDGANRTGGVFTARCVYIVLKNSYFNKGGIIDGNCFLYAEEDSIAVLAAANRLKVGFVPELKVMHQESKATGKSISRKKYGFQKEAYRYIKKTYPNIY